MVPSQEYSRLESWRWPMTTSFVWIEDGTPPLIILSPSYSVRRRTSFANSVPILLFVVLLWSIWRFEGFFLWCWTAVHGSRPPKKPWCSIRKNDAANDDNHYQTGNDDVVDSRMDRNDVQVLVDVEVAKSIVLFWSILARFSVHPHPSPLPIQSLLSLIICGFNTWIYIDLRIVSSGW